jgi:hypothetical protein
MDDLNHSVPFRFRFSTGSFVEELFLFCGFQNSRVAALHISGIEERIECNRMMFLFVFDGAISH